MSQKSDSALVKEFNDNLHLIYLFIQKHKVETAKDHYMHLLSIYNEIQQSQLSKDHKHTSYEELMTVYSALESETPALALKLSRRQQPPEEPEEPPVHPPKTYAYKPRFSKLPKSPQPTLPSQPYPHPIGAGPAPPDPTPPPGPTEKQKMPITVLGAIFMIFLLSFFVFVKPEIIGLATFDNQPKITENVFLSFSDDSTYVVELKHIPEGIGLTGKLTKLSDTGTAQVFVEYNGKKIPIFDSEQTALSEGLFYNSCIECSLPGYTTKELKLTIKATNVILDIDSIVYTVDKENNLPPEWAKDTTEITINESSTINLDEYYIDDDGDELVYVATQPNGLAIIVQGSFLSMAPENEFTGTADLMIIASDLLSVTKTPVSIIVE